MTAALPTFAWTGNANNSDEALVTLPRVVAVTGGSGQLGTHVLRRLLEDPAVERVVSIDPRPPVICWSQLFL